MKIKDNWKKFIRNIFRNRNRTSKCNKQRKIVKMSVKAEKVASNKFLSTKAKPKQMQDTNRYQEGFFSEKIIGYRNNHKWKS